MSLRRTFLAMIAILLLLNGCNTYWIRQEYQHYYEEASETEEESFRVGPEAESVELTLEGELDAGNMSVTIWSPEAEIAFSYTGTGPCNFEMEEDLPVVIGTWRIEVETLDATGFHKLRMMADHSSRSPATENSLPAPGGKQ